MTAPVCFRHWKRWLWELAASGFFGAPWGRLRRILRRCKERISANSKKRAQDQFERVETLRLEMAREAFRVLAGVISLVDFWGAQAASLFISAACRDATHIVQQSVVCMFAGSYRLAACAPQRDVVRYPLHVREVDRSFTAK